MSKLTLTCHQTSMTMRQRLQYLDMCSRGTNYHDNKWEKENSNVGRGTILHNNIGFWNAWTAGGSIGCREIISRLSNFSHTSKVVLPECKVSIALQTKWWGNSLQQSPARPNIPGHGGGIADDSTSQEDIVDLQQIIVTPESYFI